MCVWLAIAAGAQVAPGQDAWLKGFEGTWVVDNPQGSDADILLTITRDAKGVLLLKAVLHGSEHLTRYDLTGKDATNTPPGSSIQATFRTHIDNRKLVTEVWDAKPDGPPQRIETRYLESADVMVTELSRTPGGPVFNRTVLRRKSRRAREAISAPDMSASVYRRSSGIKLIPGCVWQTQ
jgi:hypothetical protein